MLKEKLNMWQYFKFKYVLYMRSLKSFSIVMYSTTDKNVVVLACLVEQNNQGVQQYKYLISSRHLRFLLYFFFDTLEAEGLSSNGGDPTVHNP